ncbi:MAG: HicB family protein [Methylovirgula sp.]
MFFRRADEVDDLFVMARDALELWAAGMRDDGMSVAAPRDFEALGADPLWRESFADAAFVIAVPPPWDEQSQAAE